MSRRAALGFVALALAALAVPPASADDLGLRGWGPRVGLSDDPDQIVVGVHFDLGEFAQNVRLQPGVDLGFGDDVTSLAGNALVGYYFDVDGRFDPYAGGQLTAAYYDIDRDNGNGNGNDNDSETEIGIAAVVGVETPMGQKGNRFLIELQLGFGDIPDLKLLAGWTFH